MQTQSFGDRVFNQRARFNMTQAELGAELGRTQTCVSYWESGRREPNLTDLERLSVALRVSIDWLVTGRQTGILSVSQSAPAPLPTAGGVAPNTGGSMRGQPTSGTGSPGDA